MTGMNLDAHDDLKQRVFRLTWQSLKAEAEALHDGAPPSASRPALERFYSQHTVELVREAIVKTCHDAGAGTEIAEFFSTDWLQQFAPRPM